MVRVKEAAPSGRRCVLVAESVPVGVAGPVRFAVGRWSGSDGSLAAVQRSGAEDLVALASAVGVMSDAR